MNYMEETEDYRPSQGAVDAVKGALGEDAWKYDVVDIAADLESDYGDFYEEGIGNEEFWNLVEYFMVALPEGVDAIYTPYDEFSQYLVKVNEEGDEVLETLDIQNPYQREALNQDKSNYMYTGIRVETSDGNLIFVAPKPSKE